MIRPEDRRGALARDGSAREDHHRCGAGAENGGGGLIERSHRVTAIANKAGVFGYHSSADSQLTTTIRMPDGSSSGWAGQPSTKLSEINSAKLAADAIEKCRRWKIRSDSSPVTTPLFWSQRRPATWCG
jgi:hypothetical protein